MADRPRYRKPCGRTMGLCVLIVRPDPRRPIRRLLECLGRRKTFHVAAGLVLVNALAGQCCGAHGGDGYGWGTENMSRSNHHRTHTPNVPHCYLWRLRSPTLHSADRPHPSHLVPSQRSA